MLFNEKELVKAGIIHKIIKQKILDYVKPNIKLIDIRIQIERWIYELIKSDATLYHHTSGIAFPIGLSLNNCAAHDSPFKNDIIQKKYTDKDIIKIDFGVQINGAIIDSAISITHNPELKELKDISIEATNIGIKYSGCDARLSEIGKAIQEIINSYEIPINGKNYKIQSCENLCGHQIYPYMIHGKKAVPNIYIPYYDQKMEGGEVYAIETFPTTGSGKLKKCTNISHYMINYKPLSIPKDMQKNTFQKIFDIRKTLAWHSDWFHKEEGKEGKEAKASLIFQKDVKNLIKDNYIEEYPPLYDVEGSYIAQTEHTIGIKETGTIIYS